MTNGIVTLNFEKLAKATAAEIRMRFGLNQPQSAIVARVSQTLLEISIDHAAGNITREQAMESRTRALSTLANLGEAQAAGVTRAIEAALRKAIQFGLAILG